MILLSVTVKLLMQNECCCKLSPQHCKIYEHTSPDQTANVFLT